MTEQVDIPVVDLQDLKSDDPEAHERAAGALLRAFGHYGLVFIRNHGLERDGVLSLYDRFLEVLERPESEKAGWGGPDIWYQRGWTPPNTEQAVIAGGQPDFKECFFAAPHEPDPTAQILYPEIHADNVWPQGADEFQQRLLDIGSRIHDVGLLLLQGCERALGLGDSELTGLIDGGPSLTRILKYLPLTEADVSKQVLWGEEHTDFNLLTLLPGGAFFRGSERSPKPERAGGLSLRTRPGDAYPNGQTLAGRPPEGCIIAQVGQQLEVLTGGQFLATPHVVAAPDQPGWTRVSMAHFVHCHARTELMPLAPFATHEALKAYGPPVLSGTYAMKTLVDIGLAPSSSIDALGYRHYGRLASIRARESEF